MFFRFFGPLLPPPPDFDLLEEDDAEEAGAVADAEAVEAAAPCRACRINLSTTRNVRGSSMSTFSSTLLFVYHKSMCTRGHRHTIEATHIRERSKALYFYRFRPSVEVQNTPARAKCSTC